MPYPYKKMEEQDFAYIRSVTDPARVWVGEAIAKEFYPLQREPPSAVTERTYILSMGVNSRSSYGIFTTLSLFSYYFFCLS